MHRVNLKSLPILNIHLNKKYIEKSVGLKKRKTALPKDTLMNHV